MASTVRDPILRVSVVRVDDAALIRLEGELDYASAPLVDQALREAEETGRLRRVVVDAAELTFLDASGLEPLLAASARLGPGGVQLRDLQPSVQRVFVLLSLTETFELDG